MNNPYQPDHYLAPHHEEAEQKYLGTVLLISAGETKHAIFGSASFIRPEKFFFQKHQWIFEAMLYLHEQKRAIDYLTLTTELKKRGQLEDIGGSAYITLLINQVPTYIYQREYAWEINDTHERRRLLAVAGTIASMASNGQQPVPESIAHAEMMLREAKNDSVWRLDQKRTFGMLAIEQVERIKSGEEIKRHPIGIAAFDNEYGGVPGVGVTCIIGCTSHGKSSVIAQPMLYHHLRGNRVYFHQWEGSEEIVMGRMISQMMKLDNKFIFNGWLPPNPMCKRCNGKGWYKALPNEKKKRCLCFSDVEKSYHERLDQVAKRMNETNSILETGKITIDAWADDFYAMHQIEPFFMGGVDHAQIIPDPNRDMVQKMEYVSQVVEQVATTLQIPILLGAQANNKQIQTRADKVPTEHDIFYSAAPAHDASMVLSVNLPYKWSGSPTDYNKADLAIQKNRMGAIGRLAINYAPELTWFYSDEDLEK